MSDLKLFESFRGLEKELEGEHAIRDRVREAVREMEAIERELTVILQAIHRNTDSASLQATCDRCDALIDGQLRVKISKLAEVIPENEYYKYSDHFRMTSQRIVFICAISHFLRYGSLITRDQVETKLGIEHQNVEQATSSSTQENETEKPMEVLTLCKSRRFLIDIEDFLTGLLMLANELGRFTVNVVTNGDYDRPKRIAQLLADLDAGFRLLTLKNDSLRRRYDSLKYELKKVEEIVYDVSIRQLTKQ